MRNRAREGFFVLLLFIGLAVMHTWPIAAAPGQQGRNSQADAKLNQWTMAWVEHQVVRDPLHLFDANIFYPERRTLAFSEHLFVPAMMGAPLAWAGASPVAVYNVVMILGFALSGWTTALVISRWTDSWLAGILSGSLMAFNAMTLTRFAHIQILHVEFLPLALLALDRLIAAPRLKSAVELALWYSLQALCSVYLLIFTAGALAVSAIVRLPEWAGVRARAVIGYLALAGTVALVVLAPFMWPYLEAKHEQEMFGRSLPEVAKYSATITDYLATGGTIHNRTWSGQFFRADGLFPGFVGLALALVAVCTGAAIRDRRARMVLAIGLMGLVLSFGPATPVYVLLFKLIPPMAAIRGAARWGQMFLAAVALLAGFGLAQWQKRLRGVSAAAVAVACILAVNVEALRAPIGFTADDQFGGIPEIFRTLDTPEPQVVVIFPFYSPNDIHMNARYMLMSTAFWKPMLNGYSGYMPTRYIADTQNLGGFPDTRSLAYLKDVGVTRVLVDSRNMPAAVMERLPQFPELSMINTDGNLRIYELKR